MVAGWSPETWRTRAQAFLNGRKSDADATTRVTVTAGEAELLRDSVLQREPAKAGDVVERLVCAATRSRGNLRGACCKIP